MPQAVVDPANLRRFAHQLKQFSQELSSRLMVLHGQLTSLGDTWRDQEHEKFVNAFGETRLMLERFMEAADLHIPYLLRKAERIEEYLNQR
jgi:uncharacterized protein YukE